MNPEDFHKMVDEILQNSSIINSCAINASDNECVYRTAADRAYYAAFLKSREWLAVNSSFQPSNNGSDHRNVQREIRKAQRLFNKRHLVSSKLYSLRRLRNEASYDLNSKFKETDAKKAIIDSQEVMQELI